MPERFHGRLGTIEWEKPFLFYRVFQRVGCIWQPIFKFFLLPLCPLKFHMIVDNTVLDDIKLDSGITFREYSSLALMFGEARVS